ncbi:MAG: hypothetical protein H7331_06285 [Bacteroidia bacterium]|nr:hypothetical protein [Bacteroidia bacterium]
MQEQGQHIMVIHKKTLFLLFCYLTVSSVYAQTKLELKSFIIKVRFLDNKNDSVLNLYLLNSKNNLQIPLYIIDKQNVFYIDKLNCTKQNLLIITKKSTYLIDNIYAKISSENVQISISDLDSSFCTNVIVYGRSDVLNTERYTKKDVSVSKTCANIFVSSDYTNSNIEIKYKGMVNYVIKKGKNSSLTRRSLR